MALGNFTCNLAVLTSQWMQIWPVQLNLCKMTWAGQQMWVDQCKLTRANEPAILWKNRSRCLDQKELLLTLLKMPACRVILFSKASQTQTCIILFAILSCNRKVQERNCKVSASVNRAISRGTCSDSPGKSRRIALKVMPSYGSKSKTAARKRKPTGRCGSNNFEDCCGLACLGRWRQTIKNINGGAPTSALCLLNRVTWACHKSLRNVQHANTYNR